MSNNRKIVIGVILIMIIIITLPLIFKKEPIVVDDSIDDVVVLPEPQMQLEIIEDTVYLQDFDALTFDTLSIDAEFGEILQAIYSDVPEEVLNVQKFVITNDINFDGTNDVAVLSGIGHGGSSIIYNYYIVNPETKKFEDYAFLPHVSNFVFDPVDRKITSTYRIGSEWYSEEYMFVDGRYINTTREVLE